MVVALDNPSVKSVAEDEELIVYQQRWVILAVFSALNLSNALMWVTYAPISDLSETYFHASTTEINLYAIKQL
jgi:FLVCR family MFS transporter 7